MRIQAQAETFVYRLAAEQPLSRVHRGIALRREDMPSDLVAQTEAALDGKPSSSLGPALLNHLDQGSGKGVGEWWTPKPESAERFSATYKPQTYVPGGPKPHYQVVVSGDGDTNSAESSMGQFWRFKNGVNPQSVRVRRQHPDNWLELPLQPGN
jgi:hypothetical protein